MVDSGVSLRWLNTFAKLAPAAYTTSDIVSKIIKPATIDTSHSRYVDSCIPSESVGRADHYISHCWSCPFDQLVQALMAHFQVQLQCDRGWDVFVWLDIFAIDQHAHGSETQSETLMALREVLGDTPSTLLILDPNGITLTRLW